MDDVHKGHAGLRGDPVMQVAAAGIIIRLPRNREP